MNTGPFLLLINADLSELGLPYISDYNYGYHSDFTVRWYKDVGRIIISTMQYNIAWPVIEFCVFFTLRVLKRFYDKSGKWKSTETKKKTIQDYVDLYSGPEYFIHYKYSFIMNITFITFMFGAGFPILFPIACLSFIVLYIMERLLLAYSYKQPPMFDESLNKTAILILVLAPMLYCSFGYWMFHNI